MRAFESDLHELSVRLLENHGELMKQSLHILEGLRGMEIRLGMKEVLQG
jgi:hypothetical protein